ncbi:sulfatase family protein [Flavicella sediminum]|uniref:sulfatase family protein n=1 Tax=Flavicella sediminum TaxID=2585141 RepID=UPI0011248AD1|nr:sulfatase-like hydrolase/transferase [Flavicella sediminum]
MKNNQFLMVFVAAVFMAGFARAQTKGSRPNIIVILADDLGYGDVGFNREANFPEDRGIIPTPHLDKLAANGVVCKNAHVVHPFCGPSRAGLLTGVYPHRIGAQYNLPNEIRSEIGIPAGETFFSKVLQNHKYSTAAFGKWHLGTKEGVYQPLDRGFDYFFGFLGGGKNYFEKEYEAAFYRRLGTKSPVLNEYQDPLQRNRAYISRDEFNDDAYLTDVLTNDAIAYIAAKSKEKDPFFMYMAYNAPHTPLQAPANEISQFKKDNPNFENLVRNSKYITESAPVQKAKSEEKRKELIEKFVSARVTYATMVANLDTNVGKLVAELKKEEGLFENTLIVFFSDNGGYTYSKGAVNYPLYALKGSVFDGGHKVPMFMHWPTKIKKKQVYNYEISALDLYPTFVDLAGAKIPKGKKIDGKNFMDAIISGKDTRKAGEAIFILRPQNGFHNGAVISYPWTIVKTGGNGKWQLFNTVKDPGQTKDLSASAQGADKIIADLQKQTVAWTNEFKDVKPAWFDHERGDGHPHRKLWYETGVLPNFEKFLSLQNK